MEILYYWKYTFNYQESRTNREEKIGIAAALNLEHEAFVV